jgi:hypothetical protein
MRLLFRVGILKLVRPKFRSRKPRHAIPNMPESKNARKGSMSPKKRVRTRGSALFTHRPVAMTIASSIRKDLIPVLFFIRLRFVFISHVFWKQLSPMPQG